MSKLIKYLKPFTASILAVIVLLFAQAMFDLSLPDYMSNIVNAKWLKENLNNEKLVIVDCRFSLMDKKYGKRSYESSHIKGALRVDIETELSDKVSTHGGRHPLPTIDKLKNVFEKIGISNDSIVVAYDEGDLAGPSRLWWILKYLGHKEVYILDGGINDFEEIGGEVVQTTSFVMRKSCIADYKGVYCRLIEPNTQNGKEEMFLSKKNRYNTDQSNFSKIPGNPVAYWVGKQVLKAFEGSLLGDYGYPKQGFATGDNNTFLRFWQEVDVTKIGFEIGNREIANQSGKKWFPCNKGGSFRRWYGNNNYLANWEADGKEMTEFKGSVIRNPQYYFRQGITWSSLTSGKLSMRYSPKGSLFESKGSVCFMKNEDNLWYILGLMNTEIVSNMLSVLSPTLDYHEGPISRVPIIISDKKEQIEIIVKQNVEICKNDWDSFETSWNFNTHPFLENMSACGYADEDITQKFTVKSSFSSWEDICNWRFNTLKSNEEELNRIFIDIYGLQDELTPEVEDKDVTVRKADLQRDIKSLISYAVGCMFGRYSLDEDGLAYAGGEWNDSKYDTFIPDEDNCIPITDEEYFEDDIVGLFCAWLKKVYGEDTLEENLDFIANALGNKGKTSREIIRNYFLTDFIKDHIKTYQKRPIYWLFDSGKQNGFKALVYMHRWNADTIGNVRVEYLHRIQRVYEQEIERMQEIIENSHNNKEISNATKRKEKLQKQIKETKEYDAKIAHLALSRIDIDLDDGVKFNYEKVQTADGKKMQILAKI